MCMDAAFKNLTKVTTIIQIIPKNSQAFSYFNYSQEHQDQHDCFYRIIDPTSAGCY